MAAQKVVVQGSSVTAPQLSELFRQIGDGNINGLNLQLFLDHKDPFALESVVINWHAAYEKLGMLLDLEKFLAEDVTGEICSDRTTWAVPVLKGMTPNKVVKAFHDLRVDIYIFIDDLDVNVPTNDRNPANGSYAVRFRKTIEADPEFANKSADDLVTERISGITLLERLLLELGYFLTIRKHLDIENVTLCAGSRSSSGSVPCVDCRAANRRLYVFWRSSRSSSGDLRTRAVVS